jgi:outer membrane protein OmpA-like peptidoglycan-associated protein
MPDQRAVTGAQSVVADDRDGSNACARVTVSLTLAVFLTSCSLLFPQPEPVPKPEPVQPVEVTPPKPESPPTEPPPVEQKITRNDQVILLPNADGSVGAVVIRQDGIEIVLDRAYASAVIEGPGQVRQLIRDPGATKETFAATLAALPPKPASFLLYFLKGKDELTAESKKEVEKMLAELAKRPAAEISVIGHTDTVGSLQFNDKLSLQRAKRVRQLLTARGIAPGSIAIAGRGERELLIPTRDKVHEPRNRRVELNVR